MSLRDNRSELHFLYRKGIHQLRKLFPSIERRIAGSRNVIRFRKDSPQFFSWMTFEALFLLLRFHLEDVSGE